MKALKITSFVMSICGSISCATSTEHSSADDFIQDKLEELVAKKRKSFTATLIALLIEKGNLDWDTQIKDVCPDEKGINSKWGKVMLQQLLTHTSGAPANFISYPELDSLNTDFERTNARKELVLEILTGEPDSEPGKIFLYSNVGYTIAGAIAEESPISLGNP